MENLKKQLIDTINELCVDSMDANENIESLERLRILFNNRILEEINRNKGILLAKSLERFLNEHKNNICDDEVYSTDDKYNLPDDLNTVFGRALAQMNMDSDGCYTGEKPHNISEEFEFIFDCCEGYENDIFYIRPYNWRGFDNADCSCGLDEYHEEKFEKLSKEEQKAYYKKDIGFHAKDCGRWDINFCYKPTGLQISWYKRPLYGAKSNQKLDKNTLEAILNNCIDSYEMDFKK